MLATPFYNGQGLGNQLANYVTVRCLAIDKGFDFGVQFPERFKGAHFMGLDMGLPVLNGITSIEGGVPEKLPDGITNYYREEFINNGDYDQNIWNVADNTLIHGNLQGIKYFEHRRGEVDSWLRVEPIEIPENVCIINFRGGEYKYVREFFLPKSYWELGISMMLEHNPNMVFEVHTDDQEEARKFFPDYKIISNIEINWRSIRYAKNLLLSNSSFAILPAWLNDTAYVIAPRGMGRRNTGEWLLTQNYIPQWNWI